MKTLIHMKYVINGSCGNNVNFSFYSDGKLVISGSGNMNDLNWYGEAPWNQYINSITSVNIKEGVTSIGAYCQSLTSVAIPKSVSSIGVSAFCRNYKLSSINIPDEVEFIGKKAFEICSELISVKLPNGITSINTQTFIECKKLSSIIIPDSVTSIGDLAFFDSGLTSICIPKNVSKIENGAFDKCSKLEAINVVENQVYMCKDGVLFSHDETELYLCPGGKKGRYSIPCNVKSIINSAFSGCSKLSYISIPCSVSNIGSNVFQDCSELSSIIIPPNIDCLSWCAFSGCANLELVILLGENTIAYSSAFDNCPKLTEVHVLPTYHYDSFSKYFLLEDVLKQTHAELLQDTFLIIAQALYLYQDRELCLIMQIHLLHGLRIKTT